MNMRRVVPALIAALALTGFAHAAVTPTVVDGNVDCADLNANNTDYPGITSDFGIKYDNDPTGDVSSTLTNNVPSWSSGLAA